jgi:hypothetical protein
VFSTKSERQKYKFPRRRLQGQNSKAMSLASLWNLFSHDEAEASSKPFPAWTQIDLQEGETGQVDPLKVAFTHGSISRKFRNGMPKDQGIEEALSGHLHVNTFPPAECVMWHWPENVNQNCLCCPTDGCSFLACCVC